MGGTKLRIKLPPRLKCSLMNKTLRSVHFGVVVVELIINCKFGVIVRNQIW